MVGKEGEDEEGICPKLVEERWSEFLTADSRTFGELHCA